MLRIFIHHQKTEEYSKAFFVISCLNPNKLITNMSKDDGKCIRNHVA